MTDHDCTTVGSVQQFGNKANWPTHVTYVGAYWSVAAQWGIGRADATFGKPWDFHHEPQWARLYLSYLVIRLKREPAFEAQVKALHGQTLLCWCTSKATKRGTEVGCHARILAEFVELLHHADTPAQDDQSSMCGGCSATLPDHEPDCPIFDAPGSPRRQALDDFYSLISKEPQR